MTDFFDLDALLTGAPQDLADQPFSFESIFGTDPPPLPHQENNLPELPSGQAKHLEQSQFPSTLGQTPPETTKKTSETGPTIEKIYTYDLGPELSFKRNSCQYFSDRAIFIKGPSEAKKDRISFQFENPEAFRNGKLFFTLDTYSGAPVLPCMKHQTPEQKEFATMVYEENPIENGHILDGSNHIYYISFICSNRCLNLLSDDRLRISLQVNLPGKQYNFEKELFICHRPGKKFNAEIRRTTSKRPVESSDDPLYEFNRALVNEVEPNKLNRELGIKMNKILKIVLDS